MSCVPEWRLSAYLDGGFTAPETRGIEQHLIGCARCRRRVILLRDEARVLGDWLHERLPEAALPTPADDGRGIALGLPLALGLVALISLAISASVEGLPRELAWLAPTQNIGVGQMTFDLIFMVRDRGAAWFDFASALAALAASAGLATFAASALLRRLGSASVALALLALLALPRSAQAEIQLRRAGDTGDARVAAGERIEGSLVASGEAVEIDGEVAGDLFAFGRRVQIRGRVDGNVFCAGQDVEITGSVGASLHCAGESVRIEGQVGGNLYTAGDDVVVAEKAHVGGDLAGAGDDVLLAGNVARDVLLAGDDVAIEGQIGRDATVHAKDLSLRAAAHVAGKLIAYLPEGDKPTVAAGATVGSLEVRKLDRKGSVVGSPFERFRKAEFYLHLVLLVASAFLVGLVLYALAPGLFGVRVPTVGRFFGAVGVGFLTVAIGLIVAVLLMITVLGIPAGLVLLAAIGAGMYVGAIVIAALIGRSLMRGAGDGMRDFGMTLLVGLLLLAVVMSLPVVGKLVPSMLLLGGLGLLVLEGIAWWQMRRAGAPSAA